MHSLELLVRLGPESGLPWRRFTLDAGASLGDLHDAIQASCGWLDCHLHAFIRPTEPFSHSGWGIAELGSETGQPEPDDVPMSVALRMPGDRVTYWYDFGDDWVHDVLVEGIVPHWGGRRLLAGEGAFPREDSGGVHEYFPMAELARRAAAGVRAADAEEEALLVWLGGWHPDAFDLEATARVFDREVLAQRAPTVPSAAVILGGLRPPPEVRERCESMHAMLRDTHAADDVVRIVRGLARTATFEASFERLRSNVPGEPRGMSAFYELLQGTSERLAELAHDDFALGSAAALEVAEFLISHQDEIPYDDDLDLHVLPLLVDASRWAVDERGLVGPLAPLFTRLAALVELDGHGTLHGLARELRKLRWTKAQRERIGRILGERVAHAPARGPLRAFVEELGY